MALLVVSTNVKPEQAYSLTRNVSSTGQGGRRTSPLLDRESSYYSQYFLVPRNDGVFFVQSRSLQAEPLSKNVQVQFDDSLRFFFSDTIRELVINK